LSLHSQPDVIEIGVGDGTHLEASAVGVPVQDRDGVAHLPLGGSGPSAETDDGDGVAPHVERDLGVDTDGAGGHLQVVQQRTTTQQQLAPVRVDHAQLPTPVSPDEQPVEGLGQEPRLGVVDAGGAGGHQDQVLDLFRGEHAHRTLLCVWRG
jgi:hypothetical protein